MGLLAACVLAGDRIWATSQRPKPGADGRLLVGMLVLVLAGGAIGAISWWLDVPGAFAWDLPPLAGRMLGGAGWSFALATFLALQRPTRVRLRLILLMLVAYL